MNLHIVLYQQFQNLLNLEYKLNFVKENLTLKNQSHVAHFISYYY